jgi:hypothetical protein
MNDIAVYTAIAGRYDRLKAPPRLWRQSADFVAFLDYQERHRDWEIRPTARISDDPCRNAKIHKILCHRYLPGVEFSVWIDGCIKITSTTPLRKFIRESLGHADLAVFPHRLRDCVYDEAAACLRQEKDVAGTIIRQIRRYRREGYPAHHGMTESCVLIRRHSRKMMLFCEAWHQEISSNSRRDQLSFNYVAKQFGLKYRLLPGTIADNPHFRRLPHGSKYEPQPADAQFRR